MKRLVRKKGISVFPTTPIYNPMGEGNEESEFAKTDEKSYSRMMNMHTMEEAEKREEQSNDRWE